MGATRRRFTEEYKEQAVAFVIDGGRPVVEVARNIGVHEMTLGKWVKKAKEEAAPLSPDAPWTSPNALNSSTYAAKSKTRTPPSTSCRCRSSSQKK